MTLDRINRGSAAAVGFLLVSGIFAALAIFAKVSLNAPTIDADRAAERSKALAEIRIAEETSLTTAAVIDAKHGTVRLPIDTALALAAQKWQNPSAARADLNARAEKSVAPVKTESFE
jgi:hypothetical protein